MMYDNTHHDIYIHSHIFFINNFWHANNAGSSMWVNIINSISSVGITLTRDLNFLIKIDFDKTVKTSSHFNILP